MVNVSFNIFFIYLFTFYLLKTFTHTVTGKYILDYEHVLNLYKLKNVCEVIPDNHNDGVIHITICFETKLLSLKLVMRCNQCAKTKKQN